MINQISADSDKIDLKNQSTVSFGQTKLKMQDSIKNSNNQQILNDQDSENHNRILDTKRTYQAITSISNSFDNSQTLNHSVNENGFQMGLNQSMDCQESLGKIVPSKRTMRSRQRNHQKLNGRQVQSTNTQPIKLNLQPIICSAEMDESTIQQDYQIDSNEIGICQRQT